MRTIKKILSAVTACAMTMSMAASGMTAGLSTVSAADKTAIELVDDSSHFSFFRCVFALDPVEIVQTIHE